MSFRPDPKPVKGDKKPRAGRLIDRQAGMRKMLRERTCRACGGSYRIERHHLVPRSQGGDDVDDNEVPLCNGCQRDYHQGGREKKVVVATAIRVSLRPEELAYVRSKKGETWLAWNYPEAEATAAS